MTSRTTHFKVKVVEGQNWPKAKNAKTPSKFHFSFCFMNGEVEKSKVITDAEITALGIEKTFSAKVEDLLNLVINNIASDILVIKMIKGDDDKNAVEFGVVDIDFSGLFTSSQIDSFHSVTITEEGAVHEESPRVRVIIELSDPLLLPHEKDGGNLLTIKLGPMQNLPRTWLPRDAQNISEIPLEFTIICALPIGDATKHYYFRGGRMYLQSEDDESGKTEAIVAWHKDTQTFFLDSEAMRRFELMCVNDEVIHFKFLRSINKDMMVDGWIDHNEKKYTGTFCKHVKELLEPGAKASCETSALSHMNADDHSFPTDPRPKSANKKKKKSKDPAPPQLLPESDDSKPYEENGTKISIEFTFENSLIPKPEERTRTNMRPSDIIPKREKVEKKKDLVELYHEEILSVVDVLVREYKSLIEKESNFDKDQFIFELNHTGKYFAFKERLKASVVQLVKEKFSHELKTKKEHEIKSFYNDIYVYLVRQMHVAINRLFNKAKSEEKKETPLHLETQSPDKLKKLADEAEAEFNFPMAARYHQERISLSSEEQTTKEFWFDYGVFSMRVNDLTKAEQSFRETLSVDMSHLVCLQMYGILLCMRNQYKEAEVFLQSAVDLDNDNYLSWGLLAMLFTLTENEKQAHQAYLYGSLALEKQHGKSPLKLAVASFLLDVNADKLAEQMLIEEMQNGEANADIYFELARVYNIREDYERAEDHLKSSLKLHYKSAKSWEMMGIIHTKLGRISDAEQELETALSVSSNPNAVLLLRLAHIYLELQKYDRARDTYLNAAKIVSSCTAWLGAGIAYFRLAEYNLSEQALNEANIQNNRNATVWGYLTLLALINKKEKEAEKCLRESLKHGLKSSAPKLTEEIKQTLSQSKHLTSLMTSFE
ncbi:hypothetical protein C9374_005530 [Naegleria lovaniensis]|uniref:Uncharacterized protein n=1 Tax=Naegleria lovaniensis TaxID=51637 RepID=A0AA88GPT2_NAELO|nr:uncharacterized protein C9374_005530 [Naegleria lovaniensis]KAG2382328.1 hypothetical protein C9374_005530 [Naegleria lovaniensis]